MRLKLRPDPRKTCSGFVGIFQALAFAAGLCLWGASAQAEPEPILEGPGVSEIDGGYLVQRGAKPLLRGTGLPEHGSVGFYGGPSTLFADGTTSDGPGFITIDTSRIPPGLALSRITLSAGYWDSERGEDVRSEKYLWVVSDLVPLNQPVFEILAEAPFIVGENYQVLTTITQEAVTALSWNQEGMAGSWADPPTPRELFEVEIVRLGRLYGEYEVLNVGEDLWFEGGELTQGQNISFLSFESSGEYELRLLAKQSGLVLARHRFVVEAEPGVNWDKEAPVPIERFPDIERRLVLPQGDEITLGQDVAIEVHWPADMENPPWDDPDHFFKQQIFVFAPRSVPDRCLADTRDPDRKPAWYVLDYVGDGVFAGSIPAYDLGVGEHWIALGGINDFDLSYTFFHPLLSAARFVVSPPPWNGVFTAEILEETPWNEQRAFRYRVTISGMAELAAAGNPEVYDFFSSLQLSSGPDRPDAWHGVRSPGARFSFEGDDLLSAEFQVVESDLRQGVNLVLTLSTASHLTGQVQLELARFFLPLRDGIRPQGLENLISFDPAPQTDGRDFPLLEQHDLIICGQETVAEESPAPNLGLNLQEVALPLPANHLIDLIFEVENLDEGTSEAAELKITFAGRHMSDPNGKMTIASALANAELGCTTDTITSEQEGEEPTSWSFTCPLPALEGGEVRLFPFLVTTPEAGLLHWEAQVETRATSGDLPLPLQNETLAEAENENETIIVEVLPIRPQRGLDSDGDFNTHFPFSGDPLVHAGDTTRHLLLIGRNIPQTREEAEISSQDVGLNYFFGSSPQTLSTAELQYETLLETGLHRYFGEENEITEILATLEDYGLTAAVIEVSILPGAGPGAKAFTLNEAEAHWNLDFGDTSVDLFFARWHDVEEVEGQEDILDRLSEAFVPENIYLMARVSPANLPLERIRAEISTNGQDDVRPIELRPVEILGEILFVSEPILMDAEGFARMNDMGEAESPEVLTISAGIDASFAARELPIAANATAQVKVLPTRPRDLWLEALRRAATCHDLNFSTDELRGPAPFRVVKELTNYMVTSAQTLTQSVSLGHHAALLLLRDQYIATSEMQEIRLSQIASTPSEVLRMFLSWRSQFEAALLSDPESPLFKLEVPDFRPGQEAGPKMEFGHIVRYAGIIEAEMREAGADDEAVISWISRSTLAAIEQLVEASATARKDVADYSDCDIQEMVEIGRGLTAIAFLLDPKLVIRDNETEYWRPDQAARNWLRGAVNVADTYVQQVAAADEDTNFLLAVASVVTLPFAASEGLAVSALSLAASATELAATAVFEISQYQASRQELMRSLGMSIVIGDIRYEQARAQEKPLLSMVVNIAASSVSTGFDVIGYMRTLQIRRGANLAERLGALDEIADLTDAQRADLSAYFDDVRRIAATKGVDALNDAQRSSYDMLGDAARGTPEAELPPSVIRSEDEVAASPLRDDPYVPPQTPRPPDAPAPLPRTPEMIAAIQRAGTSPDGIARFLPYYGSARPPMRALAETGDVIDQAWLDAMDNTFSDMLRRYPPDTVEHMLTRQTLSMLREGRAVVIFNPTMANVGEGVFDAARGQYAISLNLNRLAAGPVHGVQWELAAIFVHESGHMTQFVNQVVNGFTIGRAIREFDSSLKMSLFQRMMEDAAGRARSLTSVEALDFSLDYALQTQMKAFDPGASLSPRFQTPDAYYNGLFQFTHSEAVARAKLFFPDLSERQIIESWLAAQERTWRRFGPAVLGDPRATQLRLVKRLGVMAQNARAQLALLPN